MHEACHLLADGQEILELTETGSGPDQRRSLFLGKVHPPAGVIE